MRRFVSPYKKYIGWAIVLNILSAVFNVFSFTFLIPILSILFKTEGADKVYHFMEWGSGDLADVAKNNFYYYISQMIVDKKMRGGLWKSSAHFLCGKILFRRHVDDSSRLFRRLGYITAPSSSGYSQPR